MTTDHNWESHLKTVPQNLWSLCLCRIKSVQSQNVRDEEAWTRYLSQTQARRGCTSIDELNNGRGNPHKSSSCIPRCLAAYAVNMPNPKPGTVLRQSYHRVEHCATQKTKTTASIHIGIQHTWKADRARLSSEWLRYMGCTFRTSLNPCADIVRILNN